MEVRYENWEHKPEVNRIWIGKRFIEANTCYTINGPGKFNTIHIDKYGNAVEVNETFGPNRLSRTTELDIVEAFRKICEYHD